MIARDCEGQVMASMSSPIKYIIDSIVAEAFAAWKAVIFCKNLGLHNILLKGDVFKDHTK